MDLNAVPLTPLAQTQLRRARVMTAAWSIVVLVILSAAIAIGTAAAQQPNWTLTAILAVIAVGATLGFGGRRIAQLNRDLSSQTMTRYSGTWREQLSTPSRNAAFLRVKLPGRFMLLRSSTRPVIAGAIEAGSLKRWTKAAGHLDYSTASRLLLNVERSSQRAA